MYPCYVVLLVCILQSQKLTLFRVNGRADFCSLLSTSHLRFNMTYIILIMLYCDNNVACSPFPEQQRGGRPAEIISETNEIFQTIRIPRTYIVSCDKYLSDPYCMTCSLAKMHRVPSTGLTEPPPKT